MPAKTIYVSDDDLPLYERAQELAGGNLSRAIVTALRRYVDAADAADEGFEEVTVTVGPGKGRRQRFFGVLLADWGRTTKDRTEEYHVYQSRTGKFVVQIQRSQEYVHTGGADGSARGVRKYFSQNQSWGTSAATATLDIYDDLDEVEKAVPAELFHLISTAVQQPVIETLDI